jgi:hypothetical protein
VRGISSIQISVMKMFKPLTIDTTKPTKLQKKGFVGFVAPYLAYISKSGIGFVGFVAPSSRGKSK